MRWQFMAALMGIALLVLLVQDIPLSNYLRQVETDRLVTSLERDAFVLAGRSEETLETPPASADAASAAAALTAAARGYRDSGGARVVIVNADGVAVVTSDDDQSAVGDSYASRPEIMGALGGQITSGHRYSDTLQVDLLYVTVPIVNGQDVVGAVRLTFPEQVVTDAVTRQISVLGLVALTTVVLAGIVGFIFSATVTRRLKLLQQTTERLAAAEAEADRLGSIIEGLLVLSRTESSTAPVVECDVARVARERVEHWQPLAQELGVGIRYEGPDHAIVSAIVTAPEQIIDNFVDNALSASTGATMSTSTAAGLPNEIVVRVAAGSPGWRVSVLDDGPGLSDEDCARAFDRFWRADSDALGNGLGLAIVAQLARASRGSARLERRPVGGLEASVTFEARD